MPASTSQSSASALKHHSAKRTAAGFSLVELLVVVAVVGILAAVAYPSYQEQIRSGRRAEAQSELMRLAQFMERIYSENGCYNPDEDCSAETVGEPNIGIRAEHYTVDFSSGPTADAFTLQATPVGPQADDGILQIDELGQRYWDEDNDDAGEGESASAVGLDTSDPDPKDLNWIRG
jgi:type IV pilus assembly protein PilE